MTRGKTHGVEPALDCYSLGGIPEAHCHLRYTDHPNPYQGDTRAGSIEGHRREYRFRTDWQLQSFMTSAVLIRLDNDRRPRPALKLLRTDGEVVISVLPRPSRDSVTPSRWPLDSLPRAL